jgi:hypothetical protein
MSSAGKVFTLALSVGVLAVHPCGAEVVRADRVELQLPEGGMTLLRPPRSTSTFKHRLFDITIEVQVEGRPYFDHWKRACTSLGHPDYIAATYQAGILPRTDEYLYSRISKYSKHGISTVKGSWLEHCLIFHSEELAAKLTINLPKSALERGEINATEIEKILTSARLTALRSRTAARATLALCSNCRTISCLQVCRTTPSTSSTIVSRLALPSGSATQKPTRERNC